MIKKMFFWYMFERREGKGKEKKKKRKRKMFVWFAFTKAKKWKEENVLFTLIPSLIGEVSKRPNRHNCNFKRNKNSKNAAAFLHSTFLSIFAQFGRIGKGGPGRICEYEILCFLFSPVNQTAEILSLPSISFPFPPLPTIPSTAWKRERRKSAWT